ncbi:hypothetical protein TVAG_464070 [Trichomonas vaginalis G3]|uniref:Vps41 beta-propeller domain-containing protein n=1 Tax=Trichomonas vaginalis (strain ATCC PRA-98 / G3) TaxID=412133 RepID=A2E259_TRIV3|nr:transcription initiation from RNA polymerase II promoter [Trichomonas vaginalis G3]EAY13273.1 hypothetical protein TVAG_464070 [Trichomonas vaginalis G3]KAI5494071.1 transcription initiation from RNA polymerase II promoter [Trichomonas vaginalis G3]|eukprot:XP_001325496.1 hypothetical protein [Trichomonas vaginalis G3]
MKQAKSSAKPSKKEMPIDILTSLGYIKEKIPRAASVPLNRWALELFFEFQRSDSVNVVYTADHLEHGFVVIANGSKIPGLEDLSKILDQCFIFVFTDILVSDGKKRANEFISRQMKFTSPKISEELVPLLMEVEPQNIDSIPEILEYNLMPTPKDLQPEFYTNLNKFANECKVSGAIFLLRRYFHDRMPRPSVLHQTNSGYNRPLDVIFRSDKRKPFFDELKEEVQYNQNQIQTKKVTANKQLLPTLTSLTVPEFAQMCATNAYSGLSAFSVDQQLYLFKNGQDAKVIYTMDDEITSISFSTYGNFILAGDNVGNIVVINTDTLESQKFKQLNSMISTSCFTPKLDTQFAVGTLSGLVVVFSTSQFNPLRVFTLHQAGIAFVNIHPNGEYVASGSRDGIIRLWSLTLSACVRVFSIDKKIPISSRFSHSGELLMVVCSKGVVLILDLGTNQIISQLTIEARLVDADFSEKDTYIAIADNSGGFSFWDSSNLAGDPLISLTTEGISTFSVNFVGMNEIRLFGMQKSQ